MRQRELENGENNKSNRSGPSIQNNATTFVKQANKGILMEVRKHARKRIKERCGLPKKAVTRNAEKALREGVRHSECTGRLKKYIDYLFLSHRRGGNIRLYGNHVYIFTKSEELITVLPLPNAHKGAMKKTLERRTTDI